jgi:mRNA-degrading endonuclease RelE of RelBE toxin-antitoxin system
MAYSHRMHVFIELPSFSRVREDYFDDDQYRELQSLLLEQPKSGDVVPGTGGVQKLPWSRAGMGKRGGVRVLYYVQDTRGRIRMLSISKSIRYVVAPPCRAAALSSSSRRVSYRFRNGMNAYAKSARENIPNELLNELRKVADHAETL